MIAAGMPAALTKITDGMIALFTRAFYIPEANPKF
jgi:hypothetical protein